MIFQEEKEKLKNVLDFLEEEFCESRKELEELKTNFYGSKEEKLNAIYKKEFHLKTILASKEKPYFARLDFVDEECKKEILYIGKNGFRKSDKIIITDWRAPVSSLYYDSEIGISNYVAPDRTFLVNLLLKRQFEIENGSLINYYDVDLVSNDSLLQKYLNENNDSRLKSIVSTIQKEQNAVIRMPFNKNIIVQGVAGSGKTTVALHRIAYLVYNYKNVISEDKYLVIGPNKVFLKYIESVLPDLDVQSVKEYTYPDFVKTYLNEKIKVKSPSDTLSRYIKNEVPESLLSFKLSMEYKNMLDKYIHDYYETFYDSDISINGFKVIDKEIIKNELNEALKRFQDNISVAVTNLKKRLIKYVSDHKNKILVHFVDYSFKNNFNDEKKQELIAIKKEISSGCKKVISKHFKSIEKTTTKLYKDFILNILNYNIYDFKKLEELKINTLDYLNKGYFLYEDLASLIYIKYKTGDNKSCDPMRQVVLDEAQDYGMFDYYVLKKIFPNASFSIYGDMAQSIYEYRKIVDWNLLNKMIFNDFAHVINFNKSYRTTREIMSEADKVALGLNMSKSEMVIRKGSKVLYKDFSGIKKEDYICDRISYFKNKGYNTVAIICKNEDDLLCTSKKLKSKLNFSSIKGDEDLNNIDSKVILITNQLAKGLEFDAVIINDASENVYNSNSTIDLKLLYVALTRPLHELVVLYKNDLCHALKNS